ncbi:MAG: segregation/condensation protein A [Actinobacteria bacterium]|nr:segregation/condensation protein A [Actinomycetota bacterium]
MDIYDVSLATMTDEFIRAIEARDLDLDSATGFLIVAATLLELKSARLLPRRASEDGDRSLLEERDLLLARLVETSTYRAAGQWLWRGLEAGRSFHGRMGGLEPRFQGLAPDLLAGLEIGRLSAAAALALAPGPAPVLDTSHVAPVVVSVRQTIVELCETLKHGSTLTFEQICSGARGRIHVVVRFLALLELYKAGAIELDQADRFGDIRAAWTGEVDATEVVMDADEYAVRAEVNP